MSRGRGWSTREDQLLFTLLRSRMKHVEIAATLRRPPSSIASRIETLTHQGRMFHRDHLSPAAPSAPTLRKPRRQRLCMCCGKTFLSEGAHNRLCTTCRALSVSPYALAI